MSKPLTLAERERLAAMERATTDPAWLRRQMYGEDHWSRDSVGQFRDILGDPSARGTWWERAWFHVPAITILMCLLGAAALFAAALMGGRI